MIGTFPISCGVSGDLDISWLEFIKSCLGDFLSKDGTINDVETITLSRLLAGLQKITQALTTESLPGTSVDMLRDWCDRLDVAIYSTDTINTIRTTCEAKYKLSSGPSQYNINKIVSDLLGTVLVSIRYNLYGLSDGYLVPAPTYSYDALCSPYEYSIGMDPLSDNYQVTSRAFIQIVVSDANTTLTEAQLLRLIAVQLKLILNTLLPCWCMWDWSFGGDGFIIAETLDDADGSKLNLVAI
jgi:hypothetical protein